MSKLFTMKQSWLKCIGCGYKTSLEKERVFNCPKCGNIFDVQHKFEHRSASEWIKLFNSRVGKINNPGPLYNSGVWRFKEWIMPHLPEEFIVSRHEGNAPILPAGRKLKKWIGGDLDLWIIFEGINPSGSFKDQGMTVLVSIAKAVGSEFIVCSSTGDTSAAAALYASIAQIPCVVFLPGDKNSRVTEVQIYQPRLHGAKTVILPGVFDDGMKTVEELVKKSGYLANSKNPTRIEGHQSTVFLIAQHFNWNLSHITIAAPIGNGSNLSSLGKGLATMARHDFYINSTRLLGCQVKGANPLTSSWEGFNHSSINEWENHYKPIPAKKLAVTASTAARIGNPVSRKKVMRSIISTTGSMVTVSEEEQNTAVKIAGLDGDNVCPQTGMALAGVKKAVERGNIKKGERVVVVSTATGLKFPNAVFTGEPSPIIEAPDCKLSTITKILTT